MNRSFVYLLFFTIGFISCKNAEKPVDKLEIGKQYYRALDKSDVATMKLLLSDTFQTIIPEYDYVESFSLEDYIEKWMKWDAVFEPSYEILSIQQEDGIVKAKISKMDKRIYFLNKEPFITKEIIRFKEEKIFAVETEYINFKQKAWEKNKNELLSWVDKNHPELNGFIYDQSEKGGMKYMKAIELYENSK